MRSKTERNIHLNDKGDRRVADDLQTQGRFKDLSTDDIAAIQRMVAEDWNNLLRIANEVLT